MTARVPRAGALALAGIALFVGSSLGALALAARGEGGSLPSAYLWQVGRFTLLQASLSTLLACGLAMPVALALARRSSFAGRGLVLDLFLLPLALPQLVAVLGIAVVLGENGWANRMLAALGLPPHPSIYGLPGILIAHVFFNLPLAARLLLAALERVPAESWRLAAELGFSRQEAWRIVERPVLLAALPGVAGLVLLLCATSFTVVLTLDGGPAASTFEVAIYQALRFDFDPPLALRLAVLQLVLSGTLLLLLARLGGEARLAVGLGRPVRRFGAAPGGRVGLGLVLAAAVLVALPLFAVVLGGLSADLGRLLGEPLLWRAVAISLAIGTGAGLVAVGLAWPLAAAAIRSRAQAPALASVFEMASGASILLPPVLTGAGLFVLLNRTGEAASFAPLVVVAANGLFALPFAVRALLPALADHIAATDRLATSLGIAGLDRLRIVDLPALRRPLALAAAMGLLVSLGDLSVIALFGSESLVTLPYLLYLRLGSYRTDDAAGLALILLALTFALSAVIARQRAEGRP